MSRWDYPDKYWIFRDDVLRGKKNKKDRKNTIVEILYSFAKSFVLVDKNKISILV